MFTNVFHAWERRLHAVSKDRVVRPFEWGLDWIEPTGIRHDTSPENMLLDWASHAVADSQRFFDTPDTSDYTFNPGLTARPVGVVSKRDADAVSGKQHRARVVFSCRVYEQDPAFAKAGS